MRYKLERSILLHLTHISSHLIPFRPKQSNLFFEPATADGCRLAFLTRGSAALHPWLQIFRRSAAGFQGIQHAGRNPALFISTFPNFPIFQFSSHHINILQILIAAFFISTFSNFHIHRPTHHSSLITHNSKSAPLTVMISSVAFALTFSWNSMVTGIPADGFG